MALSLFSLKDRVAVVTGSGRGIGRGIALAFAEAGADIVVASRTEADLESVVAEVRSRGGEALAVVTDFRHSSQVDNMVQKVVERFGRIDILVNNVGGNTFYSPFLEVREEGLDADISENLKTNFYSTKAVAKLMVEQKRKGSIVNIASLAGLIAWPQLGHYGAIKAAVISLTKTLALELAPYGIRVNAIAPGFVEHEGTAKLSQRKQEERAKRLGRIPLGRPAGPQDIAAAALYLASHATDNVTGVIITIDGGMSLNWQ